MACEWVLVLLAPRLSPASFRAGRREVCCTCFAAGRHECWGCGGLAAVPGNCLHRGSRKTPWASTAPCREPGPPEGRWAGRRFAVGGNCRGTACPRGRRELEPSSCSTASARTQGGGQVPGSAAHAAGHGMTPQCPLCVFFSKTWRLAFPRQPPAPSLAAGRRFRLCEPCPWGRLPCSSLPAAE